VNEKYKIEHLLSTKHAMKLDVAVEVNFLEFLTLTLDLYRCLASRPTLFTSGKITLPILT